MFLPSARQTLLPNIWLCRHKTNSPKLIDFLCYFKHIYIIKKTQATILKKWEPFVAFFCHFFFSPLSCVAS